MPAGKGKRRPSFIDMNLGCSKVCGILLPQRWLVLPRHLAGPQPQKSPSSAHLPWQSCHCQCHCH